MTGGGYWWTRESSHSPDSLHVVDSYKDAVGCINQREVLKVGFAACKEVDDGTSR